MCYWISKTILTRGWVKLIWVKLVWVKLIWVKLIGAGIESERLRPPRRRIVILGSIRVSRRLQVCAYPDSPGMTGWANLMAHRAEKRNGATNMHHVSQASRLAAIRSRHHPRHPQPVQPSPAPSQSTAAAIHSRSGPPLQPRSVRAAFAASLRQGRPCSLAAPTASLQPRRNPAR